MPHYRLSAALTVNVDKAGSLLGKYVFLRNAAGNWREEITFPGYKRVRVGDEHIYWQLRSTYFDPLSIQDIDEFVLDFTSQLHLQKALKFSKPFKQRKDGQEYSCLHPYDEDLQSQIYCFDTSGGRVMYHENGMEGIQSRAAIDSVLFKDFLNFANKELPATIQGFSRQKLRTELRLDELMEAPELDDKLFLPPTGASRRLLCSPTFIPKVDIAVQPKYPQDAACSRTLSCLQVKNLHEPFRNSVATNS